MESTSASSTAATHQEPGWSSLPSDLLKTILDLLPWSSHPRFAAVCKHWRSVVSPFYPAWLTPILLSAVDIGTTNLRYYSPYHHRIFEEVSFTLETPNAKICSTSGRHLTVCHRADLEITVVHTDLVTGVICDLFPLDRTWFDFVIYDGERRRMYGVNAFAVFVEIARAVQSDSGGWYPWESELIFDRPMLDASLMTNPVRHRGLLYLLGIDGRLAVYDDHRHDEGFRLLDKPQGFGFDCDGFSYLFECDEGELMAVLMGRRGTPVHVLKLNEQEMQWEKVDSLRGRALFTGTPTSMMVKTDVKWMQNKIFIPRLWDWPETLQVRLVDRGGEVAFVPISTAASVPQCAGGTGIWTCGLEHQESAEFWETIKLDYSIWVDFRN